MRKEVSLVIEKAAGTPLTRKGIKDFYEWLKEFQNNWFFNEQYPQPEYQSHKKGWSHQAKLITFDGISGAGKDTQIQLLEKRIHPYQAPKFHNRTLVTKYGNPFREVLIAYWKEYPIHRDHRIEIPLLWAGRKYVIEERLLPELARGPGVVFQNRSYLSDVVFMSHNVKELEENIKLCWFDPVPDLAIVLSLDPHIAFDRICKRAYTAGRTIQPQEQMTIMEQTANLYQYIVTHNISPIVSVAADDCPKEVYARIWRLVEPVLFHYQVSRQKA